MPVWHERTKALRKSGALTVIGITQEQHPDRCRLFAQWHGIDWPILWDPFNLSGSLVVPNMRLIDEGGIARSLRARPADLATFLEGAPAVTTDLPQAKPALVQMDGAALDAPDADAWQAIGALLWRDAKGRDKATETLIAAQTRSPAHRFRAGVALRMRYDEARKSADFQQAITAWHQALADNPRQYIWRRRIQQYGPRLDKPYPFYDWMDAARRSIEDRGETPVATPVPLTRTERWGRRAPEGVTHEEPDPKAKIEPTPAPLQFEVVHVPDTGRGRTAVCAHVSLRPDAAFLAKLTLDAEAGLPVIWWAGRRAEGRIDATGHGRLTFEVELDAPDAKASGYVLYYACTKSDGVCRYLRQELGTR